MLLHLNNNFLRFTNWSGALTIGNKEKSVKGHSKTQYIQLCSGPFRYNNKPKYLRHWKQYSFGIARIWNFALYIMRNCYASFHNHIRIRFVYRIRDLIWICIERCMNFHNIRIFNVFFAPHLNISFFGNNFCPLFHSMTIWYAKWIGLLIESQEFIEVNLINFPWLQNGISSLTLYWMDKTEEN